MPFRISQDQAFALLLTPLVMVLLAILYAVVVPLQGRPFLFKSERMKTPDKAFELLKIRTMHPSDDLFEQGALGGHQMDRVTGVGAVLRKLRLDELPQIFNVLRGDIGFIGPRPPLRKYVDRYPDIYGEVLQGNLPGITGLATVVYHRREERLLAKCGSAVETERVYCERCIPRKARLDLIYRDRRSVALDVWILWQTIARLPLPKLEPRVGRTPHPPGQVIPAE